MKKGFTLIEILIVVAIIAILASVVLVGLGPTQRLGRDARRLSDLRQVQTGLALYYNKCGFYPKVSTDTTCPTTAPTAGTITWAELTTSLTTAGISVNAVPKDPNASQNYLYGVTAGGVSYVLGARLEDTNNVALNSDVDGTNVLGSGVDCGLATGVDTIYCLTL